MGVRVGVNRASVGVGRLMTSVGDGVEGVPMVGEETTSGVPNARPIMARFPSARRTSSLIEKIENCKTTPRGMAAPVQ